MKNNTSQCSPKKDHTRVLEFPESNLGSKFKFLDGPFYYLIIYEAL